MKKNLSTKLAILFLAVFAALMGYNYFQKPFLRRFEAFQKEIQNVAQTPSEAEKAKELLGSLTPKEKIWGLISVPVTLVADESEASAAAEIAFLSKVNPGFITLFGKKLDFDQVEKFTQSLPVSRRGYSPSVAVDHEGGTVQRLSGEGFTDLIDWQELCDLTVGTRKELLRTSAEEIRYSGVNIVFGPVVDIGKEGNFLKKRVCADPEKALNTADDYIEMFAHQGILPVIKHFPGIGSVKKDIHFSPATVAITSTDTYPFQSLLTKYPNIGVMTTHVVVAERTKGVPCSLSSICLDAFPKNFPLAILFTDALEMKSAIVPIIEGAKEKTLGETAAQALMAGNTVLVFGESVSHEELEDAVSYLEKRYEENEEFRKKVDLNNEKILSLKVSRPVEEEK